VHAFAIDNRQLDVAIKWRGVDWHPLHIGTIKCKHLLHSLHSILLNAEEDFGTALLNSMSSSEQHNTLNPAVREFATTVSRREAAASNNSYYAGKQSPDIHSAHFYKPDQGN
jgi:hypothetical protein